MFQNGNAIVTCTARHPLTFRVQYFVIITFTFSFFGDSKTCRVINTDAVRNSNMGTDRRTDGLSSNEITPRKITTSFHHTHHDSYLSYLHSSSCINTQQKVRTACSKVQQSAETLSSKHVRPALPVSLALPKHPDNARTSGPHQGRIFLHV